MKERYEELAEEIERGADGSRDDGDGYCVPEALLREVASALRCIHAPVAVVFSDEEIEAEVSRRGYPKSKGAWQAKAFRAGAKWARGKS